MASFSIHSFGVGGKPLPFLLPQHEKTLQDLLAPIVKEKIGCGSFTYQIRRKGITIQAADGKTFQFPLQGEVARLTCRKVSRIVQFYQNTGHIERKALTQQEEREHLTKACQCIDSMAKQAIPGAKGKILSMTTISENSLSIVRNILGGILGPDNPISSHLGYPAGFIWTGYGLLEVYRGRQDSLHALQIGDEEGQRRAIGRLCCGSIATGASVFYLAGKVCMSTGASAGAGLAMTAGGLFGVSSILGMGLSSLGILRCYRFLERLNGYKDERLTEREQIEGALRFLGNEIQVTRGEKKDLLRSIREEDPSLSDPSEIQRRLEQKIQDRTEVKIKALKRRTSNEGLQLILTRVRSVLSQIENPQTETEGLKRGQELLEQIKEQSYKKMALYGVGLFAATLSLVAFVAGTIFSMGALPFALYAIAGAIYLSITIYQFAIQHLRKDPEIASNIPQLLAPISHIS